MDNLGQWYCLEQAKGLGPVRLKTLLLLFKEPSEILKLSRDQLLAIKGIDEKIADNIIASKNNLDSHVKLMEAEAQRIESLRGLIVTLNDPRYPNTLKKTNYCPGILFMRGDAALLDNYGKSIAIVGTREVSDYGRTCARSIARELAKLQWIIVSGMARGVDSEAHLGALEVSGKTIAVLGSGIDVIYPRDAKAIYEQISEKGMIVSEHHAGTKPTDINLKKRNKITVGLSNAVVIIETSDKGGTMNAVRAAKEQKKKLFVLEPIDTNNQNIVGNLQLLRDGEGIAINLENAVNTIISELGYAKI